MKRRVVVDPYRVYSHISKPLEHVFLQRAGALAHPFELNENHLPLRGDKEAVGPALITNDLQHDTLVLTG